MAIWPALLMSSMQFRLANSRWRGLRFGFKGSMPDVYRAMLPIPRGDHPGALIPWHPDRPPSWYLATTIGATLLGGLLAPWLLWNLKRYQHNHYGLASLQTSFRASLGAFYKLHLKISGVALVVILGSAIAVGIGVYFFAGNLATVPGRKGAPAAMIGVVLGPLIGMVATLVVIKPYATSRLQNLLWSRTQRLGALPHT
jgi:uncharacterized membrane protein YjgN (DUF898 family)